ncbi:hypothetical protein THUN1379_13500 [Paludibacterium sp. THUN1379]|uniref:hypothetical protein n=1 Tax=Paludibacterium sp. THUN1379 TaxID=3112107 RepID=UPI00308D3811|nr:hypothetical protein THUN1379_13500 [Paludibacterium sp. THUN1379]
MLRHTRLPVFSLATFLICVLFAWADERNGQDMALRVMSCLIASLLQIALALLCKPWLPPGESTNKS